jgi:hypothetical protein
MEPGIYIILPRNKAREREWPTYHWGMTYYSWTIISVWIIIPWITRVDIWLHRWPNGESYFWYEGYAWNVNRVKKLWDLSMNK